MHRDVDGEARVARALKAWLGAGNVGTKWLAHSMGLPYKLVADYVSGRLPFPAWRLPDLYAATQDPELLNEICGAACVVHAATTAEVTSDALEHQIVQLHAVTGGVAEEAIEAGKDGTVDDFEKQKIRTRAQRVVRVAVRLVHWLTRRAA